MNSLAIKFDDHAIEVSFTQTSLHFVLADQKFQRHWNGFQSYEMPVKQSATIGVLSVMAWAYIGRV